MTEAWKSPRAKAEEERRQKLEATDALLDQVGRGELTVEQIAAIERELGPVAIESTFPAGYYQERQIERMERSVDGAEGGA